MCGSMDDNCANDATQSNGWKMPTLSYSSKNCQFKNQPYTSFGDSWRMNSIAGATYAGCPRLKDRTRPNPALTPPTSQATPTTPMIVPPAHCTFECAPIVDNLFSCSQCKPQFIVQRIHPVSGCLTTSCREGELKLYYPAGKYVIADYLVCESGKWVGFDSKQLRHYYDPSLKITCQVLWRQCDSCPTSTWYSTITHMCPPSADDCDFNKLQNKKDLETGCVTRSCPSGYALGGRVADTGDAGKMCAGNSTGWTCWTPLKIVCDNICRKMTSTSLSCVNGQVEDAGRRLSFDQLSCSLDAKWTGVFEGRRFVFENNRPVTCAQHPSGCSMCPSPPLSSGCPLDKKCDKTRLITCKDAISSCLLYSSAEGYELFVKTTRGWEAVDYIDCHLSNGWRLQGVDFVENKLEITCAPGSRARAQLRGCKPFVVEPTTTPSPNDACNDGCLRKEWLPIARQSCVAISVLLQAKAGPFARCYVIGEENIKELLRQCCFETCEMPEQKCARLNTFAEECQAKSTSINLDNWQSDPLANCTPSCPPNASFKRCGTACDRTCCSPEGARDCKEECTAGCACVIGFVRDDSQSDLACIRKEKCGCNDENGAYPEGKTWLSSDCKLNYTCTRHKIISTPLSCSPNSECLAVEDERRCVCKEGFEGDGRVCKTREDCKKRCGEQEGRGKCVTDRMSGSGATSCNCNNNWSGPTCSQFTPRTDCSALKKYHNITKSGVYEIMPYAKSDMVVRVRCDMETDCGGWTLISSSFLVFFPLCPAPFQIQDCVCSTGLIESNTFTDYVRGFGDPEKKDVWIGLDILSAITTSNAFSLRVELTRCDSTKTGCVYRTFSVHDKIADYRVNMTHECTGSERERSKREGWVSWDVSVVGPPFGYVDRAEYPSWCASRYSSPSASLPRDIRLPCSGWWFDEKSGFSSSNLNAPPSNCESRADFVDYVSVRSGLTWNKEPLREAFMWIRPTDFKC